MTIDEILENSAVEEFRDMLLSDSDVARIIVYLKESRGMPRFRKFLEVRKNLPIELLKPILHLGTKQDYVSGPGKWMPFLIGMFTQIKIDQAIYELIEESDFPDKCRFSTFFYWNGFQSCISFNSDGSRTEEKGIELKWNGQRYVDEKVALEKTKRLIRTVRKQRYAFLIREFKKYDNIVYQYHLALALPRSMDRIAKEQKGEAKEVIAAINDVGFPDSVSPLIELVKGDAALEDLLHKKLRWGRK